MRVLQALLGLAAFGLAVSQTSAQGLEPIQHIFRRPLFQPKSCEAPASGPVMVAPPEIMPPSDPKDKKDPMAAPPILDPQAFAQAPAAGTSAGQTFNPAMFGDLGAGTYTNVIIRGGSASSPTSRVVRVPAGVGRGDFKISDNESPRPTDRVFVAYNYFDGIRNGDNTFSIHRQLIGFEKTFLDGNASIGMRLPFVQVSGYNGPVGFLNNQIGDLTVVLKYAFINDRDTGNVLSGGLAITVPTARDGIFLPDGTEFRSVLLQPYAGWIVNRGDLFLQGFHSVVIPTDQRDVSILNNDVAIGYWLLRNNDRFIRGIVPTVEGHLFTPLDHRSSTDQIQAFDVFTITAGVNVVLPRNSTFGAGFAVPLTGPRPNQIEALVSFNWRF